MHGLPLKTGTAKPGADWNYLDRTVQPVPTLLMRGTKFNGLENNVLIFGDYGVRFTLEGVQWLKRAA